MTTSLVAPAAQICLFALGCALIHAARAHAALLTRMLGGAAITLSVLVLFAIVLAVAPEHGVNFEDIALYNAM